MMMKTMKMTLLRRSAFSSHKRYDLQVCSQSRDLWCASLIFVGGSFMANAWESPNGRLRFRIRFDRRLTCVSCNFCGSAVLKNRLRWVLTLY